MRILLFVASLLIFFGSSTVSFAQENLSEGFNDLSVRPIHASDIMFKKRVWRRMNLKEKQNASFFSNGRQLTKLIMDAARKGIVTPYESDTLGTPMSMEKLLENLTDPYLAEEEESDGEGGEEGEEDEWGSGGDDDWGGGGDDDGWGSEDSEGGEEGASGDAEGALGAEEEAASTGPGEDQMYLANQLYVVELQEDVIFDKERSRMYYDLLTVKLVVDGTLRPDGVDFDLAVFSYRELSEKLFKDNPEAIWYNPENSAAHLELQSAFDLRLFASRIIKVGNAENEHIADVFGGGDPKNILYGSEWWEMKLMQYEHELWSY